MDNNFNGLKRIKEKGNVVHINSSSAMSEESSS